MMPTFEGWPIKAVTRHRKNGTAKDWRNPTQAKLDALVKRYGARSIEYYLGGCVLIVGK